MTRYVLEQGPDDYMREVRHTCPICEVVFPEAFNLSPSLSQYGVNMIRETAYNRNRNRLYSHIEADHKDRFLEAILKLVIP